MRRLIPMSFSAGDRIGNYEITARIGKGGMGEVYRARDLRLKRDVAIKTLPSSLSAAPARVQRFLREAEVLASLNHPNIAQIYGLEGGLEGRLEGGLEEAGGQPRDRDGVGGG